MVLCDLCGKTGNIQQAAFKSGDITEISASACQCCRDKLTSAVSEVIKRNTAWGVREVIPSLTPDQAACVEALIQQRLACIGKDTKIGGS